MACPVCLDSYSTTAKVTEFGEGLRVNCPVCGLFDISRNAYDDFLDPQTGQGRRLGALNRSRIAHKMRSASHTGPSGLPRLNSEFFERYREDGFSGPSPKQQATNAIRYIGDLVANTGERIPKLAPGFFAIIGSPSPTFAANLLFELVDGNQVSGIKNKPLSAPPSLMDVNLTLDGWRIYEDEQKGRVAGKYGFMAMKFGDAELESLVSSSIKPAVKAALNFDIFDMRDVARAGVIDNIMRAQIRDAAFILVDLTHDNAGAYWEAGYAEGLGKPVIYVCEKSKFERAQTHFDTNHCTTVQWDVADKPMFEQQLVATIRRSLNLF